MLKKILASISSIAILAFLVPSQAIAAPIASTLFQTLDLTVDGATKDTFNPTSGHSLKATPTYTASTAEKTSTTGYIKVVKGTTVIKTLTEWSNVAAPTTLVSWDGKATDNNDTAKGACGNTTGAVCANGDYKVEGRVEFAAGTDTLFEIKSVDFKVISATALAINSFTVTENVDPSPKGLNQSVKINYTLSQAADNLQIEIKDVKGSIKRTFQPTNKTSGEEIWDAKVSGVIAEPGVYTAIITASKSGSNTVTLTKTFNIVYANSNKSLVQELKVTPDSFNPNIDETTISFKISQGADISVEIRNLNNSDVVRTFDKFNGDTHSAGSTHSVAWNGKTTGGSSLDNGPYRVVVTARNEFGVTFEEKAVSINNAGATISTSNDHIDNISFSPSSKFEPAKDDELKIEFDVQKDLDSLKVFAIKGNVKIELLDDEDIEEENNKEVSWDGTDEDDEYAIEGSWKIRFESKLGTANLLAEKSISVEYEKPEIDDIYVSKAKFDNDNGEFTYVIFRVDAEASVTIQLLESNQEEDDIVEDMEVEANKWYAVAWDGDNYDIDDDLEFKIIAENSANEDVFDSEKIDIDLAEDDVVGNKANITNDYIAPVLTGGNEEMELFYTIDKDADVKVTVHKGTSSSSSVIVTLADENGQDSGEHNIKWNGRDKDGNKLSTGVYTYKIVSSAGGTDTETGLFIVGTVGDVDGAGGSSSSSDDDDSQFKSGNPNVVIDGGTKSNSGGSSGTSNDQTKKCAGFSDVNADFKYCEAIKWAQSAGVFKGYSNGTFGPNITINRVEMLKTILEALKITIPASVSGNLGFTDVDTGAWYMTYLKVGKDMGIMTGDGTKKTVRPGDPVNRAEAAKVVLESLKTVGKLSSITCGGSTAFADVTASGAWFYNYVCVVGNLDLIDDIGGNFIPTKPLTRAEMAEMLFRLKVAGML